MTLQARSPLGNRPGADHPVELPMPGASRVRVTELGGQGAVLCTTAVPAEAVRPGLSGALGIDLPAAPGPVVVRGDCWAIWLSPRSWLVAANPAEEAGIVATVSERFPDRSVHASRYGDSLSWLLVRGEDAGDLLRQGGFLSLEPAGMPTGHVKRTPIADVPVLLWRQEVDAWRIGIDRSRAAWFVDWMRACLAGSDGLAR